MAKTAAQKIENLLTRAHDMLGEYRVEVAASIADCLPSYADTATDKDLADAGIAGEANEDFRNGIRYIAHLLRNGELEYQWPETK